MRKASFQAPKKPWSDRRTGLFLCTEESESRGGDEDSGSRRFDGGGTRQTDGGETRQTEVGRRAAFHGSGSEGPSGALTLPIARCVPSVLCAPNLPGISSVGRAPAREAGSAGSNPAFLLIGLTANQANTAHNRAAVVTTANRHTGPVPRAFPPGGKRFRESECAAPRRGRAATAQPVEGAGAIRRAGRQAIRRSVRSRRGATDSEEWVRCRVGTRRVRPSGTVGPLVTLRERAHFFDRRSQEEENV